MSLMAVMEYIVLENNMKDGFWVFNYASKEKEFISYEDMSWLIEESIHHILNVDVSNVIEGTITVRDLQPINRYIFFYKDIYLIGSCLVINRTDVDMTVETVSSVIKTKKYLYLLSITDRLIGRVKINQYQEEMIFEFNDGSNSWCIPQEYAQDIWNDCFKVKHSQSFFKASKAPSDFMPMLPMLDYKLYYLENKYTHDTAVAKMQPLDTQSVLSLIEVHRELSTIEGYVKTGFEPSIQPLKLYLPHYDFKSIIPDIINEVIDEIEYIVCNPTLSLNVNNVLADLFADAINQNGKIQEIIRFLCKVSNFAHIVIKVYYNDTEDRFELKLKTISYKSGESFQLFNYSFFSIDRPKKDIQINNWEVLQYE